MKEHDGAYLHGLTNGIRDLIHAVREDDQPLTADRLEELGEAAIEAVKNYLEGDNDADYNGD